MLGILATELHSIGVPYEFMRWTSDVQYPYFVGEYMENVMVNEDGCKEYDLIITGTTTGSWMELEEIRRKIEDHFPSVFGLRIPTDDGAVVFHYENSFPVDTGEADLKRIQINLGAKEWRNH